MLWQKKEPLLYDGIEFRYVLRYNIEERGCTADNAL